MSSAIILNKSTLSPSQSTIGGGVSQSGNNPHISPDILSFASGNLAASGNLTLIAAVTDQQIVISHFYITMDAAALPGMRDNVTTMFFIRDGANKTLFFDFRPFGLWISVGSSFNLQNAVATAANINTIISYTLLVGS